MPRMFKYLCTTICAFSVHYSFADEILAINPGHTEEAIHFGTSSEAISDPAPFKPALAVKPVAAIPFSPFTGKIKGKKVRLRIKPDLESHVIKELTKNELISVVGEKDNFWAIQPPPGLKAYVFRSFILENVVEGNRVNVRLEPDLEAPIIGHLNAGDKVSGVVSPLNNKWLEINPPSDARLYIAKEYVEHIGGPEVKLQHDKRRNHVEQLLETSSLLSKSELRKSYEEIDIVRLSRSYQSIIEDYSEFPEIVQQAKEALSRLQDSYMQKKIAFLESKAVAKEPVKMFGKEEFGDDSFFDEEGNTKLSEELASTKELPNDRMKMWEPIEEALYLNWARLNEDRGIDEFYEDQSITAAVSLTGLVEAFASPVKNKPGDFILRGKDLPIAYLYSTQVNLQNLVGKKVTVVAAPRSNNHFAFPAYFVLSAE